MGERLGQQVVVENRVGGSTIIGTDAVAKSAPDGYTLVLANTTTHAASAALNATLPFDPVKDFAPVAMIGVSPFVLIGATQVGGADRYDQRRTVAVEAARQQNPPQSAGHQRARSRTRKKLLDECERSRTTHRRGNTCCWVIDDREHAKGGGDRMELIEKLALPSSSRSGRRPRLEGWAAGTGGALSFETHRGACHRAGLGRTRWRCSSR